MRTNHAKRFSHTTAQQVAPSQKQVVVKVKRKGLITRGEKVLYLIIAFAFIVACYFIVSYSSSMDRLNRDVQSLEQRVEQQQMTNENLMIEIKELSKPERITKIAKENGLKVQDTEVKKARSFDH